MQVESRDAIELERGSRKETWPNLRMDQGRRSGGEQIKTAKEISDNAVTKARVEDSLFF